MCDSKTGLNLDKSYHTDRQVQNRNLRLPRFLTALTNNTDGIIHKLVMVFAKSHPTLTRFKITGDKTRRASAVNKITIPGLITSHLVKMYREPASIHQTLYLDCKNHAVPSSHLDTILAKVPRLYLVLRRVTLTKLYRRAVMLKRNALRLYFVTS